MSYEVHSMLVSYKKYNVEVFFTLLFGEAGGT
jgi:hypothetical protein